MSYNGQPAGTQTALHKGRQWRRLIRIEKAAMLTIRGFPNDVIAMHLNIHPQTLVYIKQTPEFKSRMIAIQTGILEQNDLMIREDEEYQRQELKGMVPMALMKLKELMLSGNQNIAYKASQDVLDREGTHAKVSRTAIDVKEDINFSVVNQVAASIQNILNSVPKLPIDDEGAAETIDAEFTKGATDSTSQLYQMEEEINKDRDENDMSVKKLKVN